MTGVALFDTVVEHAVPQALFARMTIVAIAEAPGAQTTGTAKLAMAWDPPELAADNLLIQETYPADKAPMMWTYLGR